jgi:hypothetical protein
MADIRSEPYAEWLEETLHELVEMHPVRMTIVAIMEDGTTGTAYFNAENASRAQMIRAIAQDSVLDFIRVNADLIGEILRGEEDEEADP